MAKSSSTKASEARAVFRQFASNLAGTLKPGTLKPGARPARGGSR